MKSYAIQIELQKGKVKEIMERLDKAQEEIYRCYSELESLGVVTIKEENHERKNETVVRALQH